eukprot:Partr_v1_DN25735_c0_g1_i2_m74576 putative Actin-associated protein
MSWKGLKKAVNRLPHMLQAKTGSAEETVDEEFDFWSDQLTELDQLSGRLHDSATKYKLALTAMLKHQQSFAQTLLECYEPIQGRYQSQESVHSSMGSLSLSRKDRPMTPEASLKRAQDFAELSESVATNLVPQLETIIERQVIRPTHDYMMLHKQLAKTVLKRAHKKLDYDRHRNSLNKAREKLLTDKQRSAEDERKIVKQESTVESSFQEYNAINTLLKSQLPQYVHMRIEFIDPILQSMVFFQEMYFCKLALQLEPLKSMVDMSTSAVSGYNARKDYGLNMVADIGMFNFQSSFKSPPISPSAAGDDSSEFDGAESVVSSTSPAKPPKPAPYVPSGQSLAASSSSSRAPVYPAASVPPAYAAAIAKKPAPPPPGRGARKAKVLFDFDAQQPGDLSIHVGDVVDVLDQGSDGSEWWKGRVNGREGSFPGNYVALL